MKTFKQNLTALATLLLIGASCSEVAPPEKLEPTPTKHQQAWQELEYYMFVHYGPNTFTNVEWGDGSEDPKVFNPTHLDTDQWASVAKAAGMKGIIITAKHHDGFCLWPSKYSTHTVRESSWKDGKGDLLKELSESCKKHGLLFGVYLSPWDRNHPAYGTSEYNQIFANTLDEVLSGYGHVFEQWFDGATDGTSKQVYDWDLYHETVYNHQPHAIIFSDIGPGCRWMGNERGYMGETNWSKMDVEGFTPGHGAPNATILNEGQANGAKWIPAEVDVSIRSGWFYSPETDDKVKSAERLMDIYYSSVGRNANLLLNVPPDRRGRIHPTDSARLMEFKELRDISFANNLAKGATIIADNVRGNSKAYAPANLLDGNKNSYWTTDDGITSAAIEVTLNGEKTFNRILLQEYIPLGQRISKFNIKVWNQQTQEWDEVKQATTVGYKRILRIPLVTTSKIRIEIAESLSVPVLCNLEIFNSPEIPSFDTGKFEKKALGKEEAIVVSLSKETTLTGFSFIPYPSERVSTVQRYDFYISTDGKQWEKVISNGIFNNIKNNPIQQDVRFEKNIKASYIKLQPTQLTGDAKEYVYSSLKALIAD
ncbi:alpha-L-fucosidase [Bacteroides sp. 224]|uniref:alpha-L-fucosidase n=1 Tax=Bacteroides sp. 224 TaxID=2302936 RepID=UPI0013D0FDD0|nr:alpha-L-fucosidase [Bacteroides sp. 224]NDV66455.1 glycoside hydrolase family 29 (alpha-L-fucosidase) [Bacteroides sp. 224]